MFATFHLRAKRMEGAPPPKPFTFHVRQVSLDTFVVEQEYIRAGRAYTKRVCDASKWPVIEKFCDQLIQMRAAEGKTELTRDVHHHHFQLPSLPKESLPVREASEYDADLSDGQTRFMMPYMRGERVLVSLFENGEVVLSHRNQPQSQVAHKVQGKLSTLCRTVTATATVLVGTLVDDTFFAQDILMLNGELLTAPLDERHDLMSKRFIDLLGPAFRIVPLAPLKQKQQLDKWRKTPNVMGVLIYEPNSDEALQLCSFYPVKTYVALSQNKASHRVTLAAEVDDDLVNLGDALCPGTLSIEVLDPLVFQHITSETDIELNLLPTAKI